MVGRRQATCTMQYVGKIPERQIFSQQNGGSKKRPIWAIAQKIGTGKPVCNIRTQSGGSGGIGQRCTETKGREKP